MTRLVTLFGDPEFLRKFHGWATLLWVAMAPVSALTGLKGSIPYLVFLSVYAIAVGHWGSWQASRAEVAINDQDTGVWAVDPETDAVPAQE